MSFEREFLTMMPETVRIAPYTGRNEYGKPQYGAFVTYRARVSGKLISLRRSNEDQITTIFDVWIDITEAQPVLSVEDKLELPNDPQFGDRYPVIFAVARQTDEDGHHHVKLQCGWMYHRQGQ